MPVYEGPTIDDAISKGLQALGVKKEAVDIEILTDAKKVSWEWEKKMLVFPLNQLTSKNL